MKTILIAIMIGFSIFASAKVTDATKNVEISVTSKGFEPNAIDVAPGVPVVLQVTRKTDDTCAQQIQIPSKNIKVDLPLNKTVKIKLGKLVKGEIRFGCGMNMMDSGKIYVK
ncbi:cupredoxin domain-containing protein [Bdellovibrio sp. qaytius]|nr:cupredoxin domain-containing protein [Bdellovibrio sp. qaytius]